MQCSGYQIRKFMGPNGPDPGPLLFVRILPSTIKKNLDFYSSVGIFKATERKSKNQIKTLPTDLEHLERKNGGSLERQRKLTRERKEDHLRDKRG
jgi:hypothetical protein